MSCTRAARGARGTGGPGVVPRALAIVAAAALLAALFVGPARAGDGGAGLSAAAPAHHPTTHHRSEPRAGPRAPGRARRRRPVRPFALHGRAMWIWELGATDGGALSSIIAGARYYKITTLVIKSSDGTQGWSQFSPAMVAALHRAHLRVCAWQYVYGNYPGVEANLGAHAVRAGADCLVIDAEVQYQGKYVAAGSYVHDLRKQIGPRYPVALAGFPYVDDHPSFPYSVFLGPGGAQYDVPQMYWRAIGVSVDAVFAHTYAFNLPYHRPIYPLGQAYGNPPRRQIVRFRELAMTHRAGGVSWWDWQDARAGDWSALAAPAGRLPHALAVTPMIALGDGARGDLVVWLQEHLVAAGQPVGVSGDFGLHTRLAVQAFQTAHGLAADGVVGPETWRALLHYRPLVVRWVHRGRRTIAANALTAAAGPPPRGPVTLPVPASASLPARRDEIPAGLGSGGR